jgi:hypothetical protein
MFVATAAALLLLSSGAQASGCRSRYCPSVTGQARLSGLVAEGFDAEAAAQGSHDVWPDPLAPVSSWTVLASITKKKPNLQPSKFKDSLATYPGAYDTSASPANPVLDANDKWVLQGANMGPSVGACGRGTVREWDRGCLGCEAGATVLFRGLEREPDACHLGFGGRWSAPLAHARSSAFLGGIDWVEDSFNLFTSTISTCAHTSQHHPTQHNKQPSRS